MRQTTTKVATNIVKTNAAQLLPAVGALVAVSKEYGYKACAMKLLSD